MDNVHLRPPKESRSQDVTALRTSASALRDEITIFMSKNNSEFAYNEPASKKESDHFEKNKLKLRELESKIKLFSPQLLFQVISLLYSLFNSVCFPVHRRGRSIVFFLLLVLLPTDDITGGDQVLPLHLQAGPHAGGHH